MHRFVKLTLILLFTGILLSRSQSSGTKGEKIEIIDTPFEKGKVRDGNKSGVWMYFDSPGELALKINYTTSQLQFLKKDTSEYAVKVNNE